MMPTFFMPQGAEASLDDQIACAERELANRERLYPGWVRGGRLRNGKAQREIVAMRAIVATLRRVKVMGR